MESRPSSSSSQQAKSRRRMQLAQDDTSESTLSLSSLPRFHPAAYSSSSASSRSATPSSVGPSPSPKLPRSQCRSYEPHRHLSVYHQTLLAQYAARDFAAVEALSPGSQQLHANYKPPSPRLVPLGSPGAVTPLALEEDNYFAAGSTNGKQDRLSVDSYIAKEAKRRGDVSPRRLTSV